MEIGRESIGRELIIPMDGESVITATARNPSSRAGNGKAARVIIKLPFRREAEGGERRELIGPPICVFDNRCEYHRDVAFPPSSFS